MIHVTEEQVRELLPMHEAVRLMHQLFGDLRAGRALNQPRRRLLLPTGACLHALAGAQGKYFGTKVYSTHPKHGAWFHFFLYDAETARPLALFDANWLGQIRTGAASAHATDLLADPEASVVGVIGSGFQAASQIEAIRCVRAVREVRVWSRDAARRERFALESKAVAVETAEAAVRGAGIVVTATFAKDPVFDAAWLGERVHINAMGSNQAAKRELPREVVERASVLAIDSTEQGRLESGDFIVNGLDWNDPRLVELKDLEPGKRQGWTVFKSNGLGVEDVAAAAFVYEQLTCR